MREERAGCASHMLASNEISLVCQSLAALGYAVNEGKDGRGMGVWNLSWCSVLRPPRPGQAPSICILYFMRTG